MKKLLYISALIVSCSVNAQPIAVIGASLYVPYTAPSYPTTNLDWMYAANNGVTQTSNLITAWASLSGGGAISFTNSGASQDKPTWGSSGTRIEFDAINNYLANSSNPSSYPINLYFRAEFNNTGGGTFFAFGDQSTNMWALGATASQGFYAFGINGGSSLGTFNEGNARSINTKYTVHIQLVNSSEVYIEVDAGSPSNSGAGFFGGGVGSITTGQCFCFPAGGSYFGGDTKIYAAARYGTQSSGDIALTKTFISSY